MMQIDYSINIQPVPTPDSRFFSFSASLILNTEEFIKSYYYLMVLNEVNTIQPVPSLGNQYVFVLKVAVSTTFDFT